MKLTADEVRKISFYANVCKNFSFDYIMSQIMSSAEKGEYSLHIKILIDNEQSKNKLDDITKQLKDLGFNVFVSVRITDSKNIYICRISWGTNCNYMVET
jgi:predicted RNA-binding protein with RPS1 domain